MRLIANSAKDAITIRQITSEASRSSAAIGLSTSSRLDSPMDALAECRSDLSLARERLVAELRAHALQIGEVTLTSGARAQYYVDAKRAILRPECFAAVGALLVWLIANSAKEASAIRHMRTEARWIRRAIGESTPLD